MQLEDIKKEIECNATSDPKVNQVDPVDPGALVVVKVETYDDITESDNDNDDDSVGAEDAAKDEETKKVAPKSTAKRKQSEAEGIVKDEEPKKVAPKKAMSKRGKCE